MVKVGDGRFELPENFYYNKDQHVYLDPEEGLIGIDQIGYEFLKEPFELKILVEKKVNVGEPIAIITTKKGIIILLSPVTGIIKETNIKALEYMKDYPYSKGFIIKMEQIDEFDPLLIKGEEIVRWGQTEAQSILYDYYTFKLIEIGDAATGKTAIKFRFTDEYFKQDLKSTIGVDFGSKELKFDYNDYNEVKDDNIFDENTKRFTIKLNIWDAAGQKHFDVIRGMYYRGAKGAIIVYDVSNPVSFNNLTKWVTELQQNLGTKIPVLLIGNKIDLGRKVPYEKAEDFAKKHGFSYIECSAKTGENVQQAFKNLALDIYRLSERKRFTSK